MKPILKAFATLSITWLTTQTFAQDVGQTMIDNAAATQYNYLSSHLSNLSLKNLTGGKATERAGRDLSYNPSPKIRDRVIDDLAVKLRFTAENTAKLKQADMNNAFAGITAPYKLRYDDAADILAAYEILNWMISNRAGDPSTASVNSVRNAAAVSLSKNREIYANAGNRAMLGEELKVLFLLLHSGWQDANKKGTAKVYSDAITKQYKVQFGQDLRTLKLDSKGLHP